jgi:HK97 gp10 family phage protein
MAKLNVRIPDEFLQKVSRLGDKTDDIVPRVLQAGAEVVLAKVKANLQAVIGKNTKYESRSTGELVSALGVSPAKVDRNGNHDVKIGFSEPRGDGNSNARIANIIEYGKSGQAAKPFLSPAKSATRKPCVEAMIQALESELEDV